MVKLCSQFDEAVAFVRDEAKREPLKVGTSARLIEGPKGLSLQDLRNRLETDPVMLVFGTGYGLSSDWNRTLDGFLGPISGPSDFNHLSVRSAVAIYLDRLMGR